MDPIKYETVFVAEPEIPTDQVDQLLNKIKQTVADHKGAMVSEDRWGRRRLAYTIRGFREGYYTVINFTAEPTVVAALDHLFNVTDTVVRHLTIRHVVRKKTFRPRRERPAGAPDVHRSGGRPGSYPRRDYVSRPPASAPSAASAPAASTPAPAPAATPAPAAPSQPEGEKPS